MSKASNLILFLGAPQESNESELPVKFIWNLSFYPLFLSFPGIHSRHFFVFFIPALSTAFPRLVKKRRIKPRRCSWLSVLLTRAKRLENHYPISDTVFPAEWPYFAIIHSERECLLEKLAAHPTHNCTPQIVVYL